MEKLIELIKETNDKDHAEIKTDLRYIKNKIAPQVAANRRAVAIILMLMAAVGFARAFASF